VKNITRDKINDLIMRDMLNSSTRVVLANAIYFMGVWVTKFDPKWTRDKSSYISASTTVMVPMMKQVRKFQWSFLKILSSSMVELPYKFKGAGLSCRYCFLGSGMGWGSWRRSLRTRIFRICLKIIVMRQN
jgi:serine protease inhibitor